MMVGSGWGASGESTTTCGSPSWMMKMSGVQAEEGSFGLDLLIEG